MLPDRIVCDSRVVDEDSAPMQERRILLRDHLRRYQCCALLVARLGAGRGDYLTAPHGSAGQVPVWTAQASEHRFRLAVGMGAGASSGMKKGTSKLLHSPSDIITRSLPSRHGSERHKEHLVEWLSHLNRECCADVSLNKMLEL